MGWFGHLTLFLYLVYTPYEMCKVEYHCRETMAPDQPARSALCYPSGPAPADWQPGWPRLVNDNYSGRFTPITLVARGPV